MTPGKDGEKKTSPHPRLETVDRKSWFQGPPEASELFPSRVLTSLLLGLLSL